MKSSNQLIDPKFPEFGTKFDTNRDRFTIYRASCLWTGVEPAEDGMFRDEQERLIRLKLGGVKSDPYRVNRSVHAALFESVKRGEFDTVPMIDKQGRIEEGTILSREQLVGFAKRRGERPAFLLAEIEALAVQLDPVRSTTSAKPVIFGSSPGPDGALDLPKLPTDCLQDHKEKRVCY